MFHSPGIPDNIFLRGKVPMTKQEIRTVTLAKGRVGLNSVVYDIGSGTGSLTVEAAFLARDGQVYALERLAEGIKLTLANIQQFDLKNAQVIEAEAPAGMAELPLADCIFIGGSGGKLEEILQVCWTKLTPGGRLVLNAITLETLWQAVQFLEHNGFAEVETVSITVARLNKVGSMHMWEGLNPIYIISGSKPEHGKNIKRITNITEN
ncbi:MAG: precorrin-6Y C5,15-methyltransferase (decarboxylating) subunit CbiT [Carboxydocellales bacterium]